MTISRRSALQGLATAGAAAATTACATGAGSTKLPSAVSPTANIPVLASDPLFNRPKAIDEMNAAGVDLILCSDPVNVFYLTNHRIVPNMLGMDGLAYASFSAGGAQKPALLTGKFSYYLASGQNSLPADVLLKLFTTPAEPELFETLTEAQDIVNATATGGYLTPEFDTAPYRTFETLRRKTIKDASANVAATSEAALLRELLDNPLPNKRVAVDDARLIPRLAKSGLDINFVDGERLLRRIRLQKSAAEVAYARHAASANAEAGLTAARSVGAGATFQELQQEFAKECGARLTKPVYILIDGVVTPLAQERIEPGRAFLIDCVSSFEGYHGDYGRTVCVGAPTKRMQQVIDALSFVWDRVLPELKVGTTYSDIWTLGQKLFSETKVDAGLIMGPHAVGLHHTDEPYARDFAAFEKDNLVLQENMVLSVDMPVLASGLGGTAHLEDLVLIGKDGPELLNPTSDRFIVV